MKLLQEPRILIVDFTSQYTKLIARTLLNLRYRSIVLTPAQAAVWVNTNKPQAIILSGGEPSIFDVGAPALPFEISQVTLNATDPVPMLCICYGMQWVAHFLGGKVEKVEALREYGPIRVEVTKDVELFRGSTQFFNAFASHGDSVTSVPDNFTITARSEGGCIQAMQHADRHIYCVQFHPEVDDTPFGARLLRNFVSSIAMCSHDWNPDDAIVEIRRTMVSELAGRRTILGFSGGVDSTTLSAILSPTLGEDLLGILIDGGHLREGEAELIRKHAEAAGINLIVVDAKARFENAFSNNVDAAMKRQVFRLVYSAILIEEAQRFGAEVIIQGTLATDLIESGSTGGARIKQHHNTDLDFGKLEQIHPLRDLFKDDVRFLAEKLGLPKTISSRKPFPGPGLFIRIIGTPVTVELLDTLRWADARVEEVLRKYNIFDEISQIVVAYDGSKTVCVKGDARAYVGSIILRGVVTKNFMTVKGYFFPEAVVEEVISILTKHTLIGRVFVYSTPKPPGTTELE